MRALTNKPANIDFIGTHDFKGLDEPIDLYLLKSDLVDSVNFEKWKNTVFNTNKVKLQLAAA